MNIEWSQSVPSEVGKLRLSVRLVWRIGVDRIVSRCTDPEGDLNKWIISPQFDLKVVVVL